MALGNLGVMSIGGFFKALYMPGEFGPSPSLRKETFPSFLRVSVIILQFWVYSIMLLGGKRCSVVDSLWMKYVNQRTFPPILTAASPKCTRRRS